jgi:hypothetical protein
MKLPGDLTKEQLIKIVERIRDWLYMDQDDLGYIKDTHGDKFARKVEEQAACDKHDIESGVFDYLNPDKTWDPDTDTGISEVLSDYDLVPTEPMTVTETHKPDPTKKKRLR